MLNANMLRGILSGDWSKDTLLFLRRSERDFAHSHATHWTEPAALDTNSGETCLLPTGGAAPYEQHWQTFPGGKHSKTYQPGAYVQGALAKMAAVRRKGKKKNPTSSPGPRPLMEQNAGVVADLWAAH